MPFLQIERTIVPIRLDGATEPAPEEIGSDSRAYGGNLRTTIRATKRNWKFNSKNLDITTAERVRALTANGAFCMVTGDALGDLTVDTNGMAAAPVGFASGGSSAGGALAAATYWYKVTGMSSRGETVGSAEVSIVTAANNKNVLNWTALVGAEWYRLYRGTATGAQNGFIDNITTNTYTDDGLRALRFFNWVTLAPPVAAVVGFYTRISLGDGPYTKVRGTHRRALALNLRQV